MGHISMIASKLNDNLRIMKKYDESIRIFRQMKKIDVNVDNRIYVNNVLNILIPLSNVIKGNLSKSSFIDEDSILNTLKKGFSENWAIYRNKILKIEEKMKLITFFLTDSDFTVLNDIGDAIDVECIILFNRMKEG